MIAANEKPRVAVVLLNLGGPLKTADIKPFLFNFFMDKNIIAAPLPIRWLLSKWISLSRGRGAALDAYAELGGKSPLLENTQSQARVLEAALQDGTAEIKTFINMRYWHPLADETVRDVKKFDPDTVILLPLYPQFSTTTSFSSVQNWDRAVRAIGLRAKTEIICCYPLDQGFIAASADLIRTRMQEAPAGTRLLFSAHGLPEKTIRAGDPYQWQCEKTAEAIVAALDMPGLDWEICYQSRVGPLKWIGPSTDEALEKAAREKKGVVVYPHAFVSEHVETLVEIEMEYREKARELGIPYFGRVETVSTHPDFIAGLAQLVRDRLAQKPWERVCPATFSRCSCTRNGCGE